MPLRRRESKRRWQPRPEELAWMLGEPMPSAANPFTVLMLEYPNSQDRERLRELYRKAPADVRARVPERRRRLLER